MTTAVVPDGVKVHTVSDITNEIKNCLEEEFPSIWVGGEISNLARPRSGHMYMSLKDDKCQLRAVIWRGIGMRLRFDLNDGMEVIVRGRVSVYPQRGEYQLVVEAIHPKGIGALELALRQLREKLFARGYFDPQRKKPLPTIPQRIALVTSPTGAAVRDMLEILSRRWPAAEIWVCPVLVQGDGAAEDIAAMIHRLNQLKPRVDLMIVGRGGGSLEDLWAFNEEAVAQAVFESAIPVVSAVGHEVDVTIADLVADKRALTPSEAAELVVPNRVELFETLSKAQSRLKELLQNGLQNAKQRWHDLAQRRAFRLPLERIRELEQTLDGWTDRLQRAGQRRLQQLQRQIEAISAHLEGLSPLNVLARGYSLTRCEKDGRLVTNAQDVEIGDLLTSIVHRGKLRSRVEEIQE